jgi:hypothetical protein
MTANRRRKTVTMHGIHDNGTSRKQSARELHKTFGGRKLDLFRHVARNSNIGSAGRHVAQELFAYFNFKTHECFPNEETLAENMHKSVSTVRRGLRELEREGYVATKRKRWSDGRVKNVYTILFSNIVIVSEPCKNARSEPCKNARVTPSKNNTFKEEERKKRRPSVGARPFVVDDTQYEIAADIIGEWGPKTIAGLMKISRHPKYDAHLTRDEIYRMVDAGLLLCRMQNGKPWITTPEEGWLREVG